MRVEHIPSPRIIRAHTNWNYYHTDKFSDYLQMTHFTVLTDNNPLTHILTSAKLDDIGQRWTSALGQYNFDIFYRAGLKNQDADGMSRYPYEIIEQEGGQIMIDNKTVHAICNMITIPAYVETSPSASINIIEAYEDSGQTMTQLEFKKIEKANEKMKRLIDGEEL